MTEDRFDALVILQVHREHCPGIESVMDKFEATSARRLNCTYTESSIWPLFQTNKCFFVFACVWRGVFRLCVHVIFMVECDTSDENLHVVYYARL